MSRREAWLSALGIFTIALVVRILAASVVVFPIPEDTAYYFGVARNIVEGRGMVSDALWSYQTPPLVLPRPAFEIWLPLPTLLIAPIMALGGTAFRVSQAMPVIVGSLVPVLAWRLAADVAEERSLPRGRARTLAIGVGLTAAVELPLVLHSTLPDSTMLFAALAVGSCIVMERVVRDPLRMGGPVRVGDPRLIVLGVLIGLAALTRNEAAWLALTWALVAWLMPRRTSPGEGAPARLSRADRIRLILSPAAVALAIFAPWAIRNWASFGSPLPGQAVTNALFVTGFDVFAYQDPPTLARYLAQGWPSIADAHVQGLTHNLLNVLLIPSFPIGLIGLIGLLALPWTAGRGARALRPLLVLSLLTFLITSLVFPVATTWGTFLHAAGPVHVLLLISCLLALDALIARIGVIRGWTRPVAWLGPTLTVSVALLFTLSVAGFGAQSRDIERRYAALTHQLELIGADRGQQGPVISDFPIWFAESQRAPALGLPNESPTSVLDLARRFGAEYLVMSGDDRGDWPGIIETQTAGADCFRPVPLQPPLDGADAEALEGTLVWRIDCP